MSDLEQSLADLEVSVRTSSAFKKAGIETLRDLVRHKRDDLIESHKFTTLSVREVEELLESMELELGMDV